MSKEVATKAETTALVNSDALSILEEFSGAGYGDVSASDFNIPRIGILGELSPELRKNDAKYIENAEAGDIADVGFGQIFKEGIEFLPVARIKEVIGWAPRKSGKGIIGRFPENYIEEKGFSRNDRNEYLDSEGNEYILTWAFYGLNLSANGRRSFLPMKKSGLKIARRWFGQTRELRLPTGNVAPLFYSSWNLGSFVDSGNGNSWYNWTFSKGKNITEFENAKEVIENATDFLKQVESGAVQGMDDRDDTTSTSEEAPF